MRAMYDDALGWLGSVTFRKSMAVFVEQIYAIEATMFHQHDL
jgi:hypothetical protein